MTEPNALVEQANKSMRRVLKAEWTGTEACRYYCMALECGHHAHATDLRAEVLCMTCLRELLGISTKRVL